MWRHSYLLYIFKTPLYSKILLAIVHFQRSECFNFSAHFMFFLANNKLSLFSSDYRSSFQQHSWSIHHATNIYWVTIPTFFANSYDPFPSDFKCTSLTWQLWKGAAVAPHPGNSSALSSRSRWRRFLSSLWSWKNALGCLLQKKCQINLSVSYAEVEHFVALF